MNRAEEANRLRKELLEAKGYIERGCTQKFCARDADGRPCPSDSKKAVCWCPVGALLRVNSYSKLVGLFDRLLTGTLLSSWNDVPGRTKEEVLHLFDLAEEELKRIT